MKNVKKENENEKQYEEKQLKTQIKVKPMKKKRIL